MVNKVMNSDDVPHLNQTLAHDKPQGKTFFSNHKNMSALVLNIKLGMVSSSHAMYHFWWP